MQKIKTVIIVILAAVIVWQTANLAKKYFGSKVPSQTNQLISPKPEKSKSLTGLESQTNGEGPVSVQVTPLDLSQDKWKFQVILNTHSVELNYDLVKLAILTDSSGKEYKPSSWEGDPPGGHHREGVLIFEAPNSKPLSIILQINNIGSIDKRAFSWDVK